MTVYIEYVIIDNFTVTYLIGLLSYRLLRLNKSGIRLLIVSTAGTACALFYPLIQSVVLSFFIKLAVWLALSCGLFLRKAKRFFLAALLFFGLTFTFGGAMFAVGFMATGSASAAMAFNLFEFPVGLLLLAGVGVYRGIRLVGLKLNRLSDTAGFEHKCTLVLFGLPLTFRGMIDTGNGLYDAKTGLPVIVVPLQTLRPLLSSTQLSLIKTGRGDSLQAQAHYMRYGTLGAGGGRILLLKPDAFYLYSERGAHTVYDVTVGVSLTEDCAFDAVLHPALLKEIVTV